MVHHKHGKGKKKGKNLLDTVVYYRLYWWRWERFNMHNAGSYSDQQHSDFVLLLICAPTHPGLTHSVLRGREQPRTILCAIS